MKYLLASVMVITIFCGLVYASIQQVLRIGANDPQIQISQDLAAQLSQNQSIQKDILQDKIDIANSLATFIIIYDRNGKPINSTAVLNGKIPVIPTGVFDSVRQIGEDRFTWQPKEGVRIAAVITGYNNANSSGFVLSGRSLREVEKREDNILLFTAFAWISSIIIILIPFLFFRKK